MTFNISADKPLQKYRQSDISIVLLTMLLWGIGIFTLYVCSYSFAFRFYGDSLYFMKRQLLSSALGFAAFAFFAVVKLDFIKRILPFAVIASIVLCWAVFLPKIGIERNGARRWLNFGIMTFQPSEMVKFIMVFFLANYFEKQSKIEDPADKTVFPAVFLVFIMMVSIMAQKNMSTTLFIGGVAVALFIISGSKIFWLVPVMTLLVPAGILSIVLVDYRLDRITGFLNQENMEFFQSSNFQLNTARDAISSGGLWGKGLGAGLMKIDSLPEIQSDYIFAGWAEAMGFCGVLAYFLILALFTWRGLSCAVKSSDRFAAVASFGFVFSIVAQSVLNIAVVVGVFPTTGIPLPFFSSGGTSILFTLASCGFLVNTSRTADIDNDFRKIEIADEAAE